MDYARYLELLDHDSARLRESALRDLTAGVPSCPGWTAAHVLLHCGEVFLHKVEAMRTGRWPHPWPPEPEPSDPAGYFDRGLSELRAELTSRKPEETTVTWYEPDQSVGFWARRMALEVVVHRADAELAAGEPIAPIPEDLAVDGVEEILVAFLAYTSMKWPQEFGESLTGADGRSVTVGTGGRRWLVRMAGSGVEAAEVGEGVEGDASVSGEAQELLLWLWGRGDGAALSYSGDPGLVERLRALLRDATQ